MRELIAFAAGIVVGAGALAYANARTKQAATADPTRTPEPSTASLEPMPNYDTMHIDCIRHSLRGLTLEQREAVKAYELEHRGRRGILNVLAALEQERVNGNA